MFKNILVAIDGSKNSYDALKLAIEIAKKFHSKIYIVAVINTANLPANVGVSYAPGLTHDLEIDAYKDLEFTEDLVKSSGIAYEQQLLNGEPRFELVDFAKNNQVDLIVMGKTGVSALQRILLGSVTRYVSEHSDKNILIVK